MGPYLRNTENSKTGTNVFLFFADNIKLGHIWFFWMHSGYIYDLIEALIICSFHAASMRAILSDELPL